MSDVVSTEALLASQEPHHGSLWGMRHRQGTQAVIDLVQLAATLTSQPEVNRPRVLETLVRGVAVIGFAHPEVALPSPREAIATALSPDFADRNWRRLEPNELIII